MSRLGRQWGLQKGGQGIWGGSPLDIFATIPAVRSDGGPEATGQASEFDKAVTFSDGPWDTKHF